MSIYFRLHYRTVWGEQLAVQYKTRPEEAMQTFLLQTTDGATWEGELSRPVSDHVFYQYALLQDGKPVKTEWGKLRHVRLPEQNRVVLADQWRARANESNAFLSSAFTQAIFARDPRHEKKQSGKSKKNANSLVLRLRKPDIPSTLTCGITGNLPQLGAWKKAIPMQEAAFPLWEFAMDLPGEQILIEYKFVLCNPDSGAIVTWETGENRRFITKPNPQAEAIIITEEAFRTDEGLWRGAGVAIPIFSLRSEKGLGIGEFADLKPLTDWSEMTGLSCIQILPVNDTLATKTWVDSYPYAAISVFALQPLYIRVDEIAPFKQKKEAIAFEEAKRTLNALDAVDIEKVLEAKMRFLRILYAEQIDTLLRDPAFEAFLNEQGHWLKPYAIFCHLRDKYKTCNFNLWPQWAQYDDSVISTLADASYPEFDDVRFWYFVQYHADRQLTSARQYAREKSVMLKGDLPIGIYRYSCDAWMAPDLYNMKEQAGAPPDDYAVDGQNWGFPTYNWQIMANDGFAWWKNRMQQLNRYFDALRIDHILGFFRIWQIPTHQVAGTLGMFNPRLPLSREEIRNFGVKGDLNRYAEAHLSRDILNSLFGSDAEEVMQTFFREVAPGDFVFRSSFPDQQTLRQFCRQETSFAAHLSKLLRLKTEVLLLEEPDSQGQAFNPRITLHTTLSYQSLPHEEKMAFDRMYNEYYYQRHNTYWQQQALWKLPALLDASDMLICGEDLGMIPATVPGVMKEMNIISLEIQRMPKGADRFGNVRAYPYFSVCSPSCHDMSTIRGWWESDFGTASAFYHDYLHWHGQAPASCLPEIVKAIVEDHLASPSMLAIFPLQDLVGMDTSMRKEDAASEQINDPSIAQHYWKFRFHLNAETLLEASQFNATLREMIQRYGRT